MLVNKILKSALIALSLVFLVLQICQYELEATGLRVLLLLLLTTLYCHNVKHSHILFFSFLVAFGIAEILNFIIWVIPSLSRNHIGYIYFTANSIYIISYALLIMHMLRSMPLLEIIKKFPYHVLIMLILDVLCVTVITGTTPSRLSFAEYSMELIYNAVIMLLLTVAFINYIHKEDKKSINLLMGSILIVFSEVIQLAYFYITQINLLNIFYSLFLVLAFMFFYLQSMLSYDSHEDRRLHEDIL